MSAIPQEIYTNPLAKDLLEKANAVSVKIGGDNGPDFYANAWALIASMHGNGQGPRPTVATFSALRSSKPEDNFYALPEVNTQEGKTGKADGFDTTAHLKFAATAIKEHDYPKAEHAVRAIENFTAAAIKRSPNLSEHQIDLLLAKLAEKTAKLLSDLKNESDNQNTVQNLGLDTYILDQNGFATSLIGFGEDLARSLYVAYFKDLAAPVVEVPNLMNVVFPKGTNPEEVMANPAVAIEKIINEMRRIFQKVDDDGAKLYIAGGHQPVIASSRGYSDVAAALAALAMLLNGYENVVLDVHKQNPILSADPRLVKPIEKLKVIQGLLYTIAAEVFGQLQGANAGAIHPDAMQHLIATALHAEIPTIVRNPQEPGRGATVISDELMFPKAGTNIIATKKLSQCLNVSGNGMVDSSGVLGFISEFFAKHVVSNSFDSAGSLLLGYNDKISPKDIETFEQELSKHFGEGFTINKLSDLAVIYCVGNNTDNDNQALIGLATLRDAGIQTYAGSHKMINLEAVNGPSVCTYVVRQNDVADATAALHENMIAAPKRVILVPA